VAGRSDPREIVILDILVQQVFAKIGRDGGSARWWNAPSVQEGIAEAWSVPEGSAIYVEVDGTEEMFAGTGGINAGVHMTRCMFTAWCVVADAERPHRRLWQLKRDALKSLYESEDLLMKPGVAEAGVWFVSYYYDRDRSRDGLSVGRLQLKAEYQPTHSDP